MRGVAAANERFDAHDLQQFACRVAVVSSGRVESLGMAAETPACVTDPPEPDHGRKDLLIVAHVSSCGLDRQRCAAGIDQARVFRALFSTTDGTRTVAVTTAEDAHMDRLNDRRLPFQTPATFELAEQVVMNPLPQTGRLPVSPSHGGCLSRTVHPGRHVLPATARWQNKPDHSQYHRMCDQRSTTPRPWRRLHRQESTIDFHNASGIHDSLHP